MQYTLPFFIRVFTVRYSGAPTENEANPFFAICNLAHIGQRKSITMKMSLVGFLASSLAFVASADDGSGLGWGKSNAEEARWLVNTGGWGTLSYSDKNGITSSALSYADSNGRIFFYLMGSQKSDAVTLTMSEAALEPTSNFANAGCGAKGKNMDPEDPRCAKLSIQGGLAPCADDTACKLGQKVLFDRHPEMKTWPVGHHFTVHEMKVEDVWMISNYGGGGTINVKDYHSVSPKHHPSYDNSQALISNDRNVNNDPVPDWNKKVERSRWIVGHSLWTTVSTTSVRLKGSAWGNIRSIVDGGSYSDGSGKPVFYLPTPDPTSIDVAKDPTISLTFSEAALAERLDPSSGKVCGGLDPMDPLCGQVTIVGKAIKVENAELKPIMKAFGERHPYAPWLAKGGAHTGGVYYTIEPTHITLLDYFGGPTVIDVDEYLEWKAPSTVSTEQQLRGAIN